MERAAGAKARRDRMERVSTGVTATPQTHSEQPTTAATALASTARPSRESIRDAALDVTGALIVACDPDGRIISFNRAAEELTGYLEGEVLGREVWDVLIPADEATALHEVFDDLSAGHFPRSYENDWVLPDGSRHRIAWRNTVLTEPDGRVTCIVGTGIDVSEERRAKSVLRDLLNATTEQAIIGTDLSGMIRIFNTGAERMLGYPPERVIGIETPVLFHEVAELAMRTRELGFSAGFDALVAMAREGHPETREWTYRRSDGSTLPVAVSVSPMRSAGGDLTGFLFLGVDGTDGRRREAALRSVVHEYARRALHDELTGLPNRSLLRDRLVHAITVAARHDRHVGLLFVDLDQFKAVNDTYGHVAGDELLVKVASRITAAARSSDTVARFGGDEFVVLCEDLHGPEELAAVAERVATSIAQQTVVGDTVLVPRASIGQVTMLGIEAEPDHMIDCADRAMYETRGLR